MTVDASRLDLRLFEITGGADRLRVTMGRPHGEAVIRMTGGASQVRIDRPADVPVRLIVRGGAASIDLDEQHIGATTGRDARDARRRGGQGPHLDRVHRRRQQGEGGHGRRLSRAAALDGR